MNKYIKLFQDCKLHAILESDTDCVTQTVKHRNYELEYLVNYDVVYRETEARTYDYPGWTDVSFENKRVTEFYIYKGDEVIELIDKEYKEFLKFLNDNLL